MHSPFERWKIRDQRRVPPPAGERVGHYLPDATFDDLPQPPRVVFGLFIEWIDASEDALHCRAQFALRADHTGELARHLHPGSLFQLFEGHMLVANGCVTEGPFELPQMLAMGL